MTDIIKLLRPQQWIKNLFVFLPLFFDRHLFDAGYLVPCILVFFAFSMAASGIYCFNDIHDAEADQNHHEKRNRPISSGKVSKASGYIAMLVCFALSVALMFFIYTATDRNDLIFLVIGTYVVMNIAYTLLLKHIAIVDVFVIAVGFVLRVLAGGVATSIHLTHWIVLMTFLLALFLAFAKRRDDVVAFENSGVAMRKTANRYNLRFLNTATSIVGSITMVCYIMYTVSPEVVERFGSPYVYLTSIFVLAGIIRYLQIMTVEVKGGDPTQVILKDRFIQGCVIGWLLAFALIIYYL
jgi:4-hydroxybenzoate polyprenyltransferase